MNRCQTDDSLARSFGRGKIDIAPFDTTIRSPLQVEFHYRSRGLGGDAIGPLHPGPSL